MAEVRGLIRSNRDIGRVEDRDVIERREESGGGIPHVITHTTRTNAETISGAGDVADQPVLVAAGDGHAGGELREISRTTGGAWGDHGGQLISRIRLAP